MREGEIGGGSELVGDENFFREAHEEPGEAERDVFGTEGEAASRWDRSEGLVEGFGFVFGADLAELRHHLLVVEDGAGDEVGEEGDEDEIGEEVLSLGLSLREIDEVGDLREGEEGDSERKKDGVRIDVGEVESLDQQEDFEEVFEVEEGEEVEGDSEEEQTLRR